MPSGLQLGVGTRVASLIELANRGALSLTDNPFDLAINGQGFFKSNFLMVTLAIHEMDLPAKCRWTASQCRRFPINSKYNN